jgi:hypothetical protein
MELSPSPEGSQLCSYSRTFQHFIYPEGSLPCSQKLSTYPYPEPGQSRPYHRNPISIRPILILFTLLRLGLPNDLFPSSFPTNILYTFLFSPIHATSQLLTVVKYLFLFLSRTNSETFILIFLTMSGFAFSFLRDDAGCRRQQGF